MRLPSFHPAYLDRQGLLGVWRAVTDGQLQFEVRHFNHKYQQRGSEQVARPDRHPLFCRVPGSIAAWEKGVTP